MIIDCTHTISPNLPGYPGDDVTFSVHSATDEQSFTSSIELGCHFGTHIDAPKHFYPEKPGVESFAPDAMRQTALWLFCEPSGRGFTLAPSIDLRSLPKVDWIFFYTGWSEKWGTDSYYQNFPGMENAITKDLLQIDISGIGIDGPSIDPVPDTDHRNHKNWLGNNRFILENLRWNDDINDGEVYTTYVVPLKIEGIEASPCRVFHEHP